MYVIHSLIENTVEYAPCMDHAAQAKLLRDVFTLHQAECQARAHEDVWVVFANNRMNMLVPAWTEALRRVFIVESRSVCNFGRKEDALPALVLSSEKALSGATSV